MAGSLGRLRNARRLARFTREVTGLELIRVGIHLGLFEALRQPLTAQALAERLGLERDLVDAWVRAAQAHGYLRECEGGYGLDGFVCWLLDAPEAASLHALLDQLALGYAPTLARLPELMKGGERPEYGGGGEARRAAAVSRLLEKRALRALERIPGARAARRVIDVGCGEGSYLVGLLRRFRDARGLGVELDAEVAEAARLALREAEVTRRGEIQVGDFMELELPAGSWDLALLNHNLHYFAPSARAALFARVAGCLAPGGLVAVQTGVVSRDATSRALGAAATMATFDLILRCHRNLYGLPEPTELAEGLREAGFTETGEVFVVPGGSTRYVWGRLP